MEQITYRVSILRENGWSEVLVDASNALNAIGQGVNIQSPYSGDEILALKAERADRPVDAQWGDPMPTDGRDHPGFHM